MCLFFAFLVRYVGEGVCFILPYIDVFVVSVFLASRYTIEFLSLNLNVTFGLLQTWLGEKND